MFEVIFFIFTCVSKKSILNFRNVDGEIVNLLNRRREDCVKYEGYEHEEKCAKMFDDFDKASLNYFIKC